jgi:hypothetical protein
VCKCFSSFLNSASSSRSDRSRRRMSDCTSRAVSCNTADTVVDVSSEPWNSKHSLLKSAPTVFLGVYQSA